MTETKMFSRRLTDEIKEVSNKTKQKNKEKTGVAGAAVESNIQVNIQTIGSPEKKNRKNSVKRGWIPMKSFKEFP